MRSDNAIKREILGGLNSSTLWKELLKSLLGRELVAFGVEVVKSVEVILDEFHRLGYLSEGGLQDLIAAAYLNDVSLDVRRPAYVKGRLGLKTNPAEVLEGVCGPFCVRLTIAGNYYYTWQFVDVSAHNTFYQAKVKQAWNGTQRLVRLWDDIPDDLESWTLYKEYASDTGEVTPHYLKLGLDAISDSVRIFCKGPKYGSKSTKDITHAIFPVQLYDGYNGGPTEFCYKVLPGHDGSVNVHFGDGIWGKPYDASLSYHIYWLDKTYGEIDLENLTSDSVTSIQANQIALDTLLNPVNLEQQAIFEIDSADNSTETIDMTYALSYVKSQLARLRGLGSVAQVRSFCNSIEGVQDCHIIADENKLNIYIKPTNPEDKYFDNIYDWLIQKGVGGMTYSVQAGSVLYFDIKVTLLGVLTGISFVSLSNAITSELQERYSRSNMLFREVVSVLEIAQIIQNIAPDVRALVELTVTEDITRLDGVFRTSLLPIRNTIYKEPAGQGSSVNSGGWSDNNGLLYSIRSAAYTANWPLWVRCGDSYICTESRTTAWDPVLLNFKADVKFPENSVVGYAFKIDDTNINKWKTFQSNHQTLMIGPNISGNNKGDIYRMSAGIFGGRSSPIYTGGSGMFSYEYFDNPLHDVSNSNIIYYPASFATICLRGGANPDAIFFNNDFKILLTEFNLNPEISYAGHIEKSYSLSIVQKGDDIFVFTFKGNTLVCEVFSYVEGRVDYRMSDTITVNVDANFNALTAVCAGPQYIFVRDDDDLNNYRTWYCYSWVVDRSIWKITLTDIDKDSKPQGYEIVNPPDPGQDIYLGHQGNVVVERTKRGNNADGPIVAAFITDGLTFTKEVRSTGIQQISIQEPKVAGHVDYDTGIISITDNSGTLEGLSYSVTSVTLPERTSTYPVRSTVKVVKGGSG